MYFLFYLFISFLALPCNVATYKYFVWHQRFMKTTKTTIAQSGPEIKKKIAGSFRKQTIRSTKNEKPKEQTWLNRAKYSLLVHWRHTTKHSIMKFDVLHSGFRVTKINAEFLLLQQVGRAMTMITKGADVKNRNYGCRNK